MFLDDNEFDHDFESNFANSKYNKYIESKITCIHNKMEIDIVYNNLFSIYHLLQINLQAITVRLTTSDLSKMMTTNYHLFVQTIIILTVEREC